MSTFASTTNDIRSRPNVTSAWTAQQREVSPPEDCLVLPDDTGGFIPWDNPDNIISQDVEQAVDTAVGAICLPILFLISAPTNILNMLVFWKQGLKERINLCLFYLSLVDFLHMLHAFVCNVDRFYLPFNQSVEYGSVFKFIADHSLVGLRSLTWLSGFISMLIACERCFCVVSPLRSQLVLSTRTTGLILAFSTAFCVTGAILNGMRWNVVCVFNPENNITSKTLFNSPFYAHTRSYLDVVILLFGGVLPVTYVTVIIASTIVTSVKLKAMMTWREQTSSKTLSSHEVTLTRMLIAVSVLYIICSLPTTTLSTGMIFFKDINLNGRYYNLSLLFVSCFELASYINATFNFFVYLSLGSKYRNTLQTLFRCSVFQSASREVAESKETQKGLN